MLLIPKLTTVNDGAFLADDTLLGSYELGGGWLRVERAKIGKRAFVGNSGMTAPGRKVPKQALVAVLSAAPRRKQGEGRDVLARQPAGQAAPADGDGDDSRTYAPATRLRVARALVEVCRRGAGDRRRSRWLGGVRARARAGRSASGRSVARRRRSPGRS